MSDESSRRDFVKGSAAGLGLLIARPQQVRGAQANSALSVGVIGCGNRGLYVGGIFAKHEFAKVTAVCDIYEDRFAAAEKRFAGARRYRAFTDLLASDVDAVLIATPAYLHPEHFEAAVAARKHIFMEKPAAVNAAGCRRVTEAARKADKTRRITVDYQQRYGADYRRAQGVVKSGELGAIKMVRAAWLGGGPAIKTGHAAAEERVRNWFFYRELSGDIFDNLACTFQFADGMVFSYSANQFRTPGGFQDVSETFICEKGAVNVSRQGYTIWRDKQAPERVETKHDITEDAVREFIQGARTGKIENAGFAAAESTLTAVMALEAIVSGSEMTWDRISRA